MAEIWYLVTSVIYMYTILWVAFLDPSDSYFLFADFVDFYTHWTYMLILHHIFLSNYWWQKSDIWSQASYRYPISWEVFLDPSDSYFLFADFVDCEFIIFFRFSDMLPKQNQYQKWFEGYSRQYHSKRSPQISCFKGNFTILNFFFKTKKCLYNSFFYKRLSIYKFFWENENSKFRFHDIIMHVTLSSP
jgi:hypothetical protein